MTRIWEHNGLFPKFASSPSFPLGLAEGTVMRQLREQKIPSPKICLISFPSAGPGGGKSDVENLRAEDAISPNLPHHFPFRRAWRKEM